VWSITYKSCTLKCFHFQDLFCCLNPDTIFEFLLLILIPMTALMVLEIWYCCFLYFVLLLFMYTSSLNLKHVLKNLSSESYGMNLIYYSQFAHQLKCLIWCNLLNSWIFFSDVMRAIYVWFIFLFNIAIFVHFSFTTFIFISVC